MKNTDEEWRRGIEQVHAEAAGLVRIFIISPKEAVYVMAAAAIGDPHCSGLVLALAESARRIESAARSEPIVCLCCPDTIPGLRGTTLVLALLGTNKPEMAIGSALCRRCAGLPDAEARVMNAMRGVWPELRQITISDVAGHA